MEYLDPAEAAYHAARRGTHAHTLVWITARNRVTGVAESIGIWDGDDHREFTISGEVRTYFGAGSLVSVEPMAAEIGLDVRIRKLSLSALSPEIEQAVRGYDVRLAPVEVHRAVFDLDTGGLVAAPRRKFRGWVNENPLMTPEIGGNGSVDLFCASASRALTRRLASYRSHEAMQRVHAGDQFREYTDVSGEIPVWWGEKREAVSE